MTRPDTRARCDQAGFCRGSGPTLSLTWAVGLVFPCAGYVSDDNLHSHRESQDLSYTHEVGVVQGLLHI